MWMLLDREGSVMDKVRNVGAELHPRVLVVSAASGLARTVARARLKRTEFELTALLCSGAIFGNEDYSRLDEDLSNARDLGVVFSGYRDSKLRSLSYFMEQQDHY